ncbi:MAG: SSU ribosomal protein S13p (S18e) [Parcubacteria group bacterium GW2011_GWA1_50_14]|nr:MAG: SSU ribosomal protein S13p (S18e) [Parcubacteria group bacterium GW2011_GWA1_50_14]
MRVAGVNIPDEKKVGVALTYIFGVGPTSASVILDKTKIDASKRTKDLTTQEVSKIKDLLEKEYQIEGELRASIRQDIGRLKIIKSYRGTRHSKQLPARGQSTKRNSRTRRGNVRATAGSGRRKLALK